LVFDIGIGLIFPVDHAVNPKLLGENDRRYDRRPDPSANICTGRENEQGDDGPNNDKLFFLHTLYKKRERAIEPAPF
jgi:hypothetical protein